jgi:hypothetical protein
MKRLDFDRVTLCSCVAAALLAGCGGSQPPIGAPGETPQTSAIAAHADRGTSWMLPEASSEDLLYVTNYTDVLVFSYPQGKLVGTLKGFYSAVGECIDSKGDVFITNFKPVNVYEYAHGGTKRIAEFPTKKAGTVGCAINPVNGDLAITGQTSYVEIFKGAQEGKPVVLQDKAMFFGQFCTYDNAGDLFFNGLTGSEKHARLSELPANSSKFTTIKLAVNIYYDGSIQWSGKTLAAISYVPWRSPRNKPEIFNFSISGTKATKVSQTPLNRPASTVLQFFIDGSTAIIPDVRAKSGQGSTVLFYNYPEGGNPYMDLTKRITDARGVVVSPTQ